MPTRQRISFGRGEAFEIGGVQHLGFMSESPYFRRRNPHKWRIDVTSGAQTEREGLAEAIRFLREGDSLVVWKLDRLGRSLKDLIDNVNTLQTRKVGFRSLQENIDTTTSGGKLIFHVFGDLAEFERDLIRERTQAGLAAARVRGRLGGRPKAPDEKKLALAISLYNDRHNAPGDICTALHISKATLYRHLPSKRVVATTPKSQIQHADPTG